MRPKWLLFTFRLATAPDSGFVGPIVETSKFKTLYSFGPELIYTFVFKEMP